jgi:hypothetical protein
MALSVYFSRIHVEFAYYTVHHELLFSTEKADTASSYSTDHQQASGSL